jgi:presenilin-like A22 family membrane protease
MKSFLQSKSNESVKRLIAFILSITLVVVLLLFCASVVWLLYYGKQINDIKQVIDLLIYCFLALISLLLSLTTAETIVSIFKKENKSE